MTYIIHHFLFHYFFLHIASSYCIHKDGIFCYKEKHLGSHIWNFQDNDHNRSRIWCRLKQYFLILSFTSWPIDLRASQMHYQRQHLTPMNHHHFHSECCSSSMPIWSYFTCWRVADCLSGVAYTRSWSQLSFFCQCLNMISFMSDGPLRSFDVSAL